jgi:ABC-2 type transport system permease protein
VTYGTHWLRTLVIGGLISYRALFEWLSPWILIPSFVVTPLAQILLFAYIGRGAGVESDAFFLVGDAVQYAAIPCLFGMTNTIVGERLQRTLGVIFVSPASRLALVAGRSVPVMVNGLAVSLFGLLAGAAVLGVGLRTGALIPMIVAILVSVFACTGLGLVNAALGLRFRDTAVVSNLLFGLLLLASGANVPRDALPGWLATLGDWLPLTHGIAAARELAAGARLTDVWRPLGTEMMMGIAYGAIGMAMLGLLERQSRRAGSLEVV